MECRERREEKSTICGLQPLVTENLKVHNFEVVVSMRKFLRDMYEYQGRLSCTHMAAEVCHKVQVVMHDLQGTSKGVLGGLALG